MNKLLYSITLFCLSALLSTTQAQSCGNGEWGIASWQPVANVVDWVDRAFSGKRKQINDPIYERANQDFLRGEYNQAKSGYTSALRTHSGDREMLARIRYQRGVCHYILGEYELAKTDFNAAIRFRPDVPDAYYFRGKIYQVAMEQPYLARRDFQRVLNMSKSPSIQQAFSHYYLGSHRQADQLMHQVVLDSRRDRDTHANALYNMAGLKALMNEQEAACRYLSDAFVSGFNEKAWLMRDINFYSIKDSPCFQSILSQNGLGVQSQSQYEPPVASQAPVPTDPTRRSDPQAPAYLQIEDLQFTDPSGNNRVDIDETTFIEFSVMNNGSGVARNMELIVSEENGKTGLGYSQSRTLGNLESGYRKQIRVEVVGGRDLAEGDASFKIMIKEQNGFDSNPAYITLPTGEAYTPNLMITDPHFTSTVGGKARPGVPMILKLAVQNTGQGVAREVFADIILPSNVFSAGEKSLSLGNLGQGDFKVLDVEFFTNRRYAQPTIPIQVNIREATGQFQQSQTFTVTMNEDLEVDARVVISPNDKPVAVDVNQIQLRSDVDKDLPRTSMRNPDAIAVVIGNRDYANPDVPSVDFALNDALSMKRYLVNVLGYDENNVIVLSNASQADFNGMFGTNESHKARLFNLVKNGSSDVFVYYSGHGAPDLDSNEGYFVPVDCDPTLVKFNGYAIKTLYDNLAKIPYRKLTVVIDACFSGSSDKGTLMPYTSLARIRTSSNLLSDPNATVLTSATNDQVATWYPEQFHGLFTYYFLKGLQGDANQDRDRRLTLGELKIYLNEQVPYMARRLRNRTQTPEIYGQDSRSIINY